MASTLDTCDDRCGWIAGIVAAVAFGSFGVPVRHTKNVDVHPLVLQSFKTMTMFCFSWGVLLLNVTPSWTWWGLLSGFLIVMGGTGGIYAIRMAGLAIAVGTWASVMVLMNFIWGILVFHEPINDVGGTAAAFLLLALGLAGMSIYAAPPKHQDQSTTSSEPAAPETTAYTEMDTFSGPSRLHKPNTDADEDLERYRNMETSESFAEIVATTKVIVFEWRRIRVTQRRAGILGAVFNGVVTGSSLIPLHYAKEEGFGGANYMISIAGGALISNVMLWIILYLYNCHQVMFGANDKSSAYSSSVSSLTVLSEHTVQARKTNNDDDDDDDDDESMSPSVLDCAYQRMPAWHLDQLTGPGLAAGALLSVAMFGSVLSVTYLGQGIGNSIVQTKILVSGLWGILLFREIRGTGIIAKWFLSAALTVLGIVWLSHERILATRAEGGGH